jgi:pyruvate formate lyase activating enzyme
MTSGIVFDLRRYSIHDGPGIRTAVFFKGCPLACKWCHNPEGISFQPELLFRANRCILCEDCLPVCPTGSIRREQDTIRIDRQRCRVNGACAAACPADALEVAGREWTVDQVLDAVERDRAFYKGSGGGVTFTGGEPLAQPDFLAELLAECRERGLHTTLDTSGYAPWPVLDRLRPWVDLFLFDLKLMNDDRHREWTGVSNEDILDNLSRLAAAGQAMRVRIPLIPGVNDDEANLHQAGEFLASLPVPPPVELLAYHDLAGAKYSSLGKDYALAELRPVDAQRMQRGVAILGKYGIRTVR